MKKLTAAYHFLIALAALCGILLQCGITEGQLDLTSFRMFTTLSNLAVMLYYLWDAVCLCRKKDVGQNAWRFLITMGILLTGLVAHFMLRDMFSTLHGPQKLGLTLLHYVVPILTLLDYFLFTPKGQSRLWMPAFSAIFPIVYVLVSMLAAQWMTGADRYPYPFLNVDRLGWGTVLLNILGLAIGYFAVGFLGCGLDHLWARKHR